MQAAAPDVVFVASYPAGSTGMVRAVREVGYAPRMLGGAMIGLQLTPIKGQLGPLLNGLVINENYVPESTMKFAGVDEFLAKYQERARGAGVDPIGFWSPFAYAELQVLSQAVGAVGVIDQARIADHLHKAAFKTIVGDVKFGPLGEWEKSRILYVQYQNIQGNDINQFRQPGKAVILYPREFKSGELIYPTPRRASNRRAPSRDDPHERAAGRYRVSGRVRGRRSGGSVDCDVPRPARNPLAGDRTPARRIAAAARGAFHLRTLELFRLAGIEDEVGAARKRSSSPEGSISLMDSSLGAKCSRASSPA